MSNPFVPQQYSLGKVVCKQVNTNVDLFLLVVGPVDFDKVLDVYLELVKSRYEITHLTFG